MSSVVTRNEEFNTGMQWGKPVDSSTLKDLYYPQQISRFRDIPGGIDNLKMTTIDSFLIPEVGEVKDVVFKGYVRVVRASPTTEDWATSIVYTNMVDMRLRGETEAVGPINVSCNPRVTSGEVVCSGQIVTPPEGQLACTDTPAKDCRIAVSAFFDIPNLGVTLFNKEPIMLCIDGITTMPPGGAHGVGRFHKRLPLYNLADPDGRQAAWLTKLEFLMGDYITEEEKAQIIAQTN